MSRRLTLATRGSALALSQSRWVAERLMDAHPGLEVELLTIRTTGDLASEAGAAAREGRGLFTREVEQAVLEGRADLAVHSLKDLPLIGPEGLATPALTERADPRDVLVSRSGACLDELPHGARVGSSSPRRIAQLAHVRPDLHFIPLRGNVDTRLRKLHEEDLDAIVLAGAGLLRLGLEARVTEWLPPEVCVPAPGQGILAVQTRRDDHETAGLAQAVACHASLVCATAERTALGALRGGCRTPAGFLATVQETRCVLQGVVLGITGQPCFRGELTGDVSEAADMGRRLAEQLLAAGAATLLA